MNGKILVIDDEEIIRFTFESFLIDEGHSVVCAKDYDEARARIAETDFDLILADIILELESGIEILREVRQKNLNCPVVMITGDPNIETAAEAVRLGAFDYLPKPVRQEDLLRVTNMALKHKALSDEKDQCRSNLEAIFRSIKDAIVTVDGEKAVVEFNEAAVDMCEFSREIIGKKFDSLPKGCQGSCLAVLNETVRTNQPIQADRIECQLGRRPRRIVNVTAYPLIEHQGIFTGGVMVLRDETRLGAIQESRIKMA